MSSRLVCWSSWANQSFLLVLVSWYWQKHKIQDEKRLGNLTGLCLHSQLIYSIRTSSPDHPPLLKLYQEEANIWQKISLLVNIILYHKRSAWYCVDANAASLDADGPLSPVHRAADPPWIRPTDARWLVHHSSFLAWVPTTALSDYVDGKHSAGLARRIHVGVLIPIFPNTMATIRCLKIIRCNVVLLSAVAIPQKKL